MRGDLGPNWFHSINHLLFDRRGAAAIRGYLSCFVGAISSDVQMARYSLHVLICSAEVRQINWRFTGRGSCV